MTVESLFHAESRRGLSPNPSLATLLRAGLPSLGAKVLRLRRRNLDPRRDCCEVLESEVVRLTAPVLALAKLLRKVMPPSVLCQRCC